MPYFNNFFPVGLGLDSLGATATSACLVDI